MKKFPSWSLVRRLKIYAVSSFAVQDGPVAVEGRVWIPLWKPHLSGLGAAMRRKNLS
ncbi:MAG: hypothetical protein HY078_16435 [Elusimicrobia bacterium]|nr:hypothetical protein [Elusimicrobiota bacterium]